MGAEDIGTAAEGANYLVSDPLGALFTYVLHPYYIACVVLLSRYALQYSPLKDWRWLQTSGRKRYVVLAIAAVTGVAFWLYESTELTRFYQGVRLLISYTLATSMYELLLQWIFGRIETITGIKKK